MGMNQQDLDKPFDPSPYVLSNELSLLMKFARFYLIKLRL